MSVSSTFYNNQGLRRVTPGVFYIVLLHTFFDESVLHDVSFQTSKLHFAYFGFFRGFKHFSDGFPRNASKNARKCMDFSSSYTPHTQRTTGTETLSLVGVSKMVLWQLPQLVQFGNLWTTYTRDVTLEKKSPQSPVESNP